MYSLVCSYVSVSVGQSFSQSVSVSVSVSVSQSVSQYHVFNIARVSLLSLHYFPYFDTLLLVHNLLLSFFRIRFYYSFIPLLSFHVIFILSLFIFFFFSLFFLFLFLLLDCCCSSEVCRQCDERVRNITVDLNIVSVLLVPFS